MNFETKMASKTMRLRWTVRLAVVVMLFLASVVTMVAQSGSSVQGTINDAKGGLIPGASVTLRNEATGKTAVTKTDAQGHFVLSGVVAGSYSVEASNEGFTVATKKGVVVSDGQTNSLSLTLGVQSATDEITVDADRTHSVAAALAPMDALLEEHSARTEITNQFIQNFTSPLADYGEAVEMAPGTFTTNGNGVGLGQSKTFFRGFNDGNYDIDFDGLPFYDTNSPTHHSWAFFPSQWVGGIDFDRSPGTASTTGPTPFGGSIHLISRDLSPVQNVRGGISYGSFGTLLADVQYDSGAIGHARKAFMFVDVQHMDSKGYQTNNFQNRNAGSIKMLYKFSDKTTLTGFSGVVWVDANTPNFNATRCQMYGAQTLNGTAYTCTGTNALYAGAGIRFYLAGASDLVNPLSYFYNRYHIPTDFEYVGFHTDLAHRITLDVKPYTYNYDNGEFYTNITPITEAATVNGSTTYMGLAIKPCNVPVAGVLPCAVDKYNSYRKYGQLTQASMVTKPAILRAGLWYDWAHTNRHQFPTDPLNNYADQALPNFSENFWTNSFQPYVEAEFHPVPKLSVVVGTKFAYFTISTKQLPDNGKTIGNLCNTTVTPATCAPFVSNSENYSAWLPSADASYHILSNWTAYAQVSTGSIIPPSSVFDYNQTITPANPAPMIQTPAKQQRSTTYQGGSVVKLRYVTLDVDAYRIKFQNSYTSSTNLDPAVFFLNPDSVTKGFEGEGNITFGHGLSAYLNASYGNAYYTGNFYVPCTAGAGCTATTPLLTESAPAQLWVANTPSNIETEGLTYQNHGFDFGFFEKRVGPQRLDNKAFHNQNLIDPFNISNLFLNYTVRRGSLFDQTKIRLSLNNVFDQHSITNYGITGAAVSAPAILANGASYADKFNTVGYTPVAGGDTVSILPGRSITLSVTFGLTPKR